MGTLVRKFGWNVNNAPCSQKNVGYLSDGTAVVCLLDPNQVGVTGDGSDGSNTTKLYILTQAPNTNTWTLQHTIGAGMPNRPYYSMAVGANNNLHILYRDSDSSLKYRLMTYVSAGSPWTLGSTETVASGVSGDVSRSRNDIDVMGTGNNAVVVNYQKSVAAGNKWGHVEMFVRTNSGTWIHNDHIQVLGGDTQYAYSDTLSVAAKQDAISGNVGSFCWVVPRKNNGGKDFGDIIWYFKVDVSTGATITSKVVKSGFNTGVGNGYREYKLFYTGTDEWTLGGTINTSPWTGYAGRFKVNPTSLAVTETYFFRASPNMGTVNRNTQPLNAMGVTWTPNALVFFAKTGVSSGYSYDFVARFDSDADVPRWSPGNNRAEGGYLYGNTVGPDQIFTGHSRNFASGRMLTLMTYLKSGSTNAYRVEQLPIQSYPYGPVTVVPGNTSTVSTNRPTLTSSHKLNIAYPMFRTRMQWQIAADPGFTTNLRVLNQTDADYISARDTNKAGVVVNSSRVVDADNELSSGTWYIRARMYDEIQRYSPWEGTSKSFTVYHPPSTKFMSPTGGQIVKFGSGLVTFKWTFTDPAVGDTQSAYRIQVEVNATGESVVDSGWVSSAANQVALSIPADYKDIQLRWKVTVRDRDSYESQSPSYQTFYVTQEPVPAIVSPTAGSTINTAIPTISWSSNSDAGGTGRIGYVSAWGSGTTAVTVPTNVALGDIGIAMVSVNDISATYQPVTPPPGWTQVATISDTSMLSYVYHTTVDGGIAGGAIGGVAENWTIPGFPKWTVVAGWYRGYALVTSSIVSAIETGSTTTHASPTGITAYSSAIAVLLNSVKASSMTTVTGPNTYTVQVQQKDPDPLSNLSGTIISSIADKDAPAAGGGYGAGNWTADVASGQSTSFSMYLRPTSATALTKAQIAYRVTITKGVLTQWTTGWVLGTATSVTPPPGILKNDQTYMVTVDVRDNFNMEGRTSIAFATEWTPPSAPGPLYVHLKEFASRGFVYIGQDNTGSDADFIGYRLYRRKYGETGWTIVQTWHDMSKPMAYRDYLVSSGTTYQYAATQVVDRFGDMIESDLTNDSIYTVVPYSENYWLLDPVTTSDSSIPLYITTEDSFSEEYEMETYNLIGRGRKVDYGDRLGFTGSLNVQCRDKQVSSGSTINYALNPGVTQHSISSTPDNWSLITSGDATVDYVTPLEPPPHGKDTVVRYRGNLLGDATTDYVRLEQVIDLKTVQVNNTFTLSAWTWRVTDRNLRLTIIWKDVNGTTLGSQTATNPTISEYYVDSTVYGSPDYQSNGGVVGKKWQRQFISQQAPANTRTATIRIQLEGTGGSNPAKDVDLMVAGIQFEIGSVPTAYVDGNQRGAIWLGEPYISPSQSSGFYTGRQQREAILKLKASKINLYLRNPFGDLWRVAPGDIAATRLPGTGRSDFSDITIPYQEVIADE
jgi:hypothetical protein